MAIPWLTIGAGLYLGGSYAWKWYAEKNEKREPPQKNLPLPRVDEGANIPLYFGKCRVRSPIIAWIGTPHFFDAQDYFDFGGITGIPTGDMYACSMFLLVGIPFEDGTQKIHRMWAGEMPVTKYDQSGFIPGVAELEDLDGNGGFEDNTRPCLLSTKGGDWGSFLQGKLEFLNGNASQQLVDPVTFEPSTVAGRYMTVSNGTGPGDLQGDLAGWQVSGYRGFTSVMLYNAYGNTEHWALGPQPRIPQFSFEMSTYPRSDRALSYYDRIGDEANPAAVIYEILVSPLFKLGIATDRIDLQSFIDAAVRLYQEAHGYSRAIEDDLTAEDIIGEVLTQIGAVLYEDNSTGLLTLKLLRNDYDPATIPHVTKHNCRSARPSAIGWTDAPNKVRVVFRNRLKDYQEDSVTAQNLAAIFADGKVVEVVIDMPGVCTAELAQIIADRELAALSRPLQALRLQVDRSFVRVNYGQAIRVSLTDPDISGLIFRVVGIDRGTIEDGNIALECIQDSYYVFRGRIPEPPAPIDDGRIRGGVIIDGLGS